MYGFSKQNLICCICGKAMEVGVQESYHAFEEAVCGKACFYEKEWRKWLSIMNKPYKEQSEAYRKEHE